MIYLASRYTHGVTAKQIYTDNTLPHQAISSNPYFHLQIVNLKDDIETSNLEKRRRESKVTIIEEDEDDDEDESPLKMFEYDEGDENIEEGAEGVIEDGLLSTSEIVPKFSKLRRTVCYFNFI